MFIKMFLLVSYEKFHSHSSIEVPQSDMFWDTMYPKKLQEVPC
jgi:hypothetical protein